ncbi:SMP-30/gluconolactonase/LRE family protein [Nocardia sp. XZ_19_385]|uniref:SMP-30/gluconolactonase/LRE family protein n=1 Tax=Nocardia sp. XZ_19_385 TaxID=2769488 RepID=UPI00188F6B6D|nr:SMP-30/gluconolactonase/LRE family protein [Nocardia sp. XZ_19_385]
MRTRGNVAISACTALSGVALTLTGGGPMATADTTPAASCGSWSRSVVASGYNMLEGLAFDGRGGLLLSDQAASGVGGAIRRLDVGARSTVTMVDGPGAVLVSGDTAYYVSGLSLSAVLSAKSDGAINVIDLNNGATSTVAANLRLPNGLAQLPNGDFVFTSDMGPDQRVSLVRNGSYAGPLAGPTSTNGVTYDAERRRLFVSTTFDPTTTIAMYDIDRPGSDPTLFTLPGFGPLNGGDDLTVGPDGNVYLALSTGGKVVRLDPNTGASCTVADGLPLTTAVEFGSGPGWDLNALYATSYLGTVTELSREH